MMVRRKRTPSRSAFSLDRPTRSRYGMATSRIRTPSWMARVLITGVKFSIHPDLLQSGTDGEGPLNNLGDGSLFVVGGYNDRKHVHFPTPGANDNKSLSEKRV